MKCREFAPRDRPGGPVQGEQKVLSSLAAMKDDLRPLGFNVQVEVRDFESSVPAHGAVEARLDIENLGNLSCAVDVDLADEASLASLSFTIAHTLHSDVLNQTGRIWPAESPGSTEPLMPLPGGWARPDGELVLGYGGVLHAAEHGPGEARTVRWWLDSSEHGVIGDDHGDLAFTYHDIAFEGDRLRSFRGEGSGSTTKWKTECVVRTGRQPRCASLIKFGSTRLPVAAPHPNPSRDAAAAPTR